MPTSSVRPATPPLHYHMLFVIVERGPGGEVGRNYFTQKINATTPTDTTTHQ
jgi:hypothetical protein